MPYGIVAGVRRYAPGQLPAALPAGAFFVGEVFLATAQRLAGARHLPLGPGGHVVDPERCGRVVAGRRAQENDALDRRVRP